MNEEVNREEIRREKGVVEGWGTERVIGGRGEVKGRE